MKLTWQFGQVLATIEHDEELVTVLFLEDFSLSLVTVWIKSRCNYTEHYFLMLSAGCILFIWHHLFLKWTMGRNWVYYSWFLYFSNLCSNFECTECTFLLGNKGKGICTSWSMLRDWTLQQLVKFFRNNQVFTWKCPIMANYAWVLSHHWNGIIKFFMWVDESLVLYAYSMSNVDRIIWL